MINVVGRDLFLNALAFVLLVLIIILPFIRDPQTPVDPTVKPPGDMMICIFWAGHHDVDLWATAPGQDIATGYSNKNGTVFDLVRDDLGTDTVPGHTECQFARGLPDGRFVINLHGYKVTAPVPVHVEVRISGDYGFKLILQDDLVVKQKQEITVAQFRLSDGSVVPGSLNRVHVPLREAGK